MTGNEGRMVACSSGDARREGVDESNIETRAPGAATGKEGDECSGFGLAPCGEGPACMFTEEAQCGATDAPGKCLKTGPAFCPEVILPICGCDGNTYQNDCIAASKGVSVASQGACTQ